MCFFLVVFFLNEVQLGIFLVKIMASSLMTMGPQKVVDVSGNTFISGTSRLVKYYNLARIFCRGANQVIQSDLFGMVK